MKIYKHLTISLIASLLTFVVGYGGYNLYAAGEDDDEPKNYYTFTNHRAKFDSVKDAYHGSLNEFFNDKFEQVSELLKEDKFYENPNFNAPSGVNSSNYKELCSRKNVSTYCVSMQALDLYIAYLETLNNMKNQLPKKELDELKNSHPDAGRNELIQLHDARNSQIDREIESVKSVLIATIDAYDQFRLAYPSHIRYQKLIKEFNKYKIALERISDQTVKFPGKFIDATSVECK